MKVYINVIFPVKYSNFAEIFLEKLAIELLDWTKIKEYAINLKRNKQLDYRPIYSLKPIELETLKSYIKINLVNTFI